MYTLGFIGVGNMGGALLTAALKNVSPKKISVFDLDTKKTESLKRDYGVVSVGLEEVAKNSDFVILGVKPYAVEGVLDTIKPFLRANKNCVLVSMAAGVSLWQISRYLDNEECAVIRIMPNTPCAVGSGVIQFSTQNVDDLTKKSFVNVFSLAGLLDEISESKIDAASALSGCGPAFVYLFAEALADAAVECGLPRDKAVLYAAKTLQGTGKMLEEYGHVSDLKDAVCSPGGSTIAGVHALEKGGLRGTVMDAVVASYQKTLKLNQ